MLSSNDVKREVFRRYNQQPRGWHVFVRRDQKGYYDTIIVHDKDLWFMKEEQINPYELVGFGVEEEIENKGTLKDIAPYQFGFRPLPKKLLDEIMEAFSKNEKIDGMMSKIMSIKPLPIDKIRSDFLIHGPLVYPPKSLNLISNQSVIDTKLRVELDKLLYKKYPHLFTTYR
ncbi:MAG: hypothetical protein ACUVWK_02360 [Nitrososphaerales archaeon]